MPVQIPGRKGNAPALQAEDKGIAESTIESYTHDGEFRLSLKELLPYVSIASKRSTSRLETGL